MSWLTKILPFSQSKSRGEESDLTGLKLIKAFTTEDEPKVLDFPKAKYTAYWETVLQDIPGGYLAIVRFYGFQGNGLLETFNFIETSVGALKLKVNKCIRQTMAKYER